MLGCNAKVYTDIGTAEKEKEKPNISVHPSFQLVAEASGTVAHPSMLAPVQSSAYSSLLPSTPTLEPFLIPHVLYLMTARDSRGPKRD